MLKEPSLKLKLPESYGVDRLVALPCDHRTIFTFWEISKESWLRAGGQLYLAVNLLPRDGKSPDKASICETMLIERIGSLYLRAPAGESVQAEISGVGLVSNTVLVPRPLEAKSVTVLHAYSLSP